LIISNFDSLTDLGTHVDLTFVLWSYGITSAIKGETPVEAAHEKRIKDTNFPLSR
jgi:hypothetical protein